MSNFLEKEVHTILQGIALLILKTWKGILVQRVTKIKGGKYNLIKILFNAKRFFENEIEHACQRSCVCVTELALVPCVENTL